MDYSLREIHSDEGREQNELRALLKREGLSLDRNLDYTCGLFDEEDHLIATGSSFDRTLRCFAVDGQYRGKGLLNPIVSHLMERLTERGYVHQFIYTKTESAPFFQDLGFYEIAQVEKTLSFLENRKEGFASFCSEFEKDRRPGKTSAIVLHANPFTLGHLRLIERASQECTTVHLLVLSEESGLIPFSIRWKLVSEGVSHLGNVICHPSGPYLISNATFPSYFFPDENEVIRSHAKLDTVLFARIAKAFGVSVRYVGQEPKSRVTGLYNEILREELPKSGIECIEIPRFRIDGQIISASTVRQAIHEDRLEEVRAFLPSGSYRFFQSSEAQPVIETIRKCPDVLHY